MIVVNLSQSAPFTTKDGSSIRSLLDLSNAPVKRQSLAEASIPEGGATQRHRHPGTEEFYFVTQGRGRIQIEGESREIGLGDAVLIPEGSAHKIWSLGPGELKILCACAPPYSHEDTQILE